MDWTILRIVAAVCAGGAVGGLVSSLLPRSTDPSISDASTRFDWLKNIFIGMVAGFLAWLPNLSTYADAKSFTAAQLVGAFGSTIMVGITGAKWLSSHLDQQQVAADKAQLKDAVVQAVKKVPDAAAASQILKMTKVEDIVNAVKGLKDA